ncbi:DUF2934 domain-containing protein [Mesorhizobium sp.]|uniref:DUF2934 domain-containing protein n=1 Tax=Mesorhizobium sp. TaxID=1871066 RepID=UPI00338D9EEE
MSDDKHERIRRRAYEIWEREGQKHGLHERHWNQATFEIENEDRSLGARPPAISDADVPTPVQTQSRAKKGKRAAGQSDVEAAEALAMRTGIPVTKLKTSSTASVMIRWHSKRRRGAFGPKSNRRLSREPIAGLYTSPPADRRVDRENMKARASGSERVGRSGRGPNFMMLD